MKGDFSKLTFDVAKHFSRVMMQQGRVQLDSDWNEQTAILLHYLQSLAKDLIGEHGGPQDNTGFNIETIQSNKEDFKIGPGHYYVDGFLIEMDTQEVKYKNQKDLPLPDGEVIDKDGIYLVYLGVWERHITIVEDDSIREVALGGPDTTTRSKIVWQVKITDIQPVNKDKKLKDVILLGGQNWRDWVYDVNENRWLDWKKQWQPENRGMIKARAIQDQKIKTDPCITSPVSSYRGTENQHYRIEIHQSGNAWDGKEANKNSAANFKWSRDNGSVVTAIKLNGSELTVDNPRGFSVGKWVELTNDNQELRGNSGLLRKIKNIDCDTIVLDVIGSINAPGDVPQGENWPTKARLWESDALPIQETENGADTEKTWIKLEGGVQIQFQKSVTEPQHTYRSGDYWLIPARVATGDVEWPLEGGKPKPLPPHGVEHHYAPLAILNNKLEPPEITDLRKQFEAQAK